MRGNCILFLEDYEQPKHLNIIFHISNVLPLYIPYILRKVAGINALNNERNTSHDVVYTYV